MNRFQIYFKQTATEDELNALLAAAEAADFAETKETAAWGIVRGAVAEQRQAGANLTVDLVSAAVGTAYPFIAYDRAGRRLYLDAQRTNVDISVDHAGAPTGFVSPGNIKWLSVFACFKRTLSDPRTDGRGQTVYYSQAEGLEFKVYQGVVGASPSRPTVPPTGTDYVLLADIRLSSGATSVVNADIYVDRRDDWMRYQATATELGGPSTPLVYGDAKASIAAVLSFIDGLYTGGSPVPAGSVAYDGGGAWANGDTNLATDVEAQLDKIIADLAATAGADRIGAAAGAAWHTGTIAAARVQPYLAEIVTTLANAGGTPGTRRIGHSWNSASWAAAASDSPSAANARDALAEIVNDLAAVTTGATGATASGGQRVGLAPYDPPGAEGFTISAPYELDSAVAWTAQKGIRYAVDALNHHRTSGSGEHDATTISFSAGSTWLGGGSIAATDVKAALDEIVATLAAQAASPAIDGAARVGAQASVGGPTPNAFVAGSVRSHLDSLLSWLNAHINSGGHAATTISFSAPTWSVTGVALGNPSAIANVDQALAAIVGDLSSQASGSPYSGAAKVGVDAVTTATFTDDGGTAGRTLSLASGSVRSQHAELLGALKDLQVQGGAYIPFPASGFFTGISAHLKAAVQRIPLKLASTTANEGASQIGVEDAASYFGTANVEAVLAEIWSRLIATAAPSGASVVGIEDAAGYFVATNVEAALAETRADLANQATSAKGVGLIGQAGYAGSPTSLSSGTLHAAITELLSAINGRALKSGDTFTGDLLYDNDLRRTTAFGSYRVLPPAAGQVGSGTGLVIEAPGHRWIKTVGGGAAKLYYPIVLPPTLSPFGTSILDVVSVKVFRATGDEITVNVYRSSEIGTNPVSSSLIATDVTSGASGWQTVQLTGLAQSIELTREYWIEIALAANPSDDQHVGHVALFFARDNPLL